MYSDRFAGCARPEIQERVVVHDQTVVIQKPWEHYTPEEKARAIAYKFGCGDGVALFMLYMEAELEAAKARMLNLEERIVASVSKIDRVSDEATEGLKLLGDRVTAIDTKP